MGLKIALLTIAHFIIRDVYVVIRGINEEIMQSSSLPAI
jgi:hypothetical protein